MMCKQDLYDGGEQLQKFLYLSKRNASPDKLENDPIQRLGYQNLDCVIVQTSLSISVILYLHYENMIEKSPLPAIKISGM